MNEHEMNAKSMPHMREDVRDNPSAMIRHHDGLLTESLEQQGGMLMRINALEEKVLEIEARQWVESMSDAEKIALVAKIALVPRTRTGGGIHIKTHVPNSTYLPQMDGTPVKFLKSGGD